MLPQETKTVGAYYDQVYHQAHFPDLIRDDEYFQARAEVAARFYFSPAERDRRILEYGCGIGQNLAGLPHAAGWDIGAESIRLCGSRGLTANEPSHAECRFLTGGSP